MKEKNEKIGFYIRITGYFFVAFSAFMGMSSQQLWSMYLLLGATIFIILGYIFDLHYKGKYDESYCIQCTVLAYALLIWFLIALFSPETNKDYIVLVAFEGMAIITTVLFWTTKVIKDIASVWSKVIRKFCTMKLLLFVLLVVSLICIDTLKWIPVWDDVQYVKSLIPLRAWDFTLSNSNAFLTCGHLSIGARFASLPGVILAMDANYGLHSVLIFMIIITVIFLYCLFEKLLPQLDSLTLVLAVAMVVLFPPILATQNANVDYYALLFLVWFITAYFNKWYVFQFIFALLLCFSKEPMIVIYSGFCVGIYAKKVLESRESGKVHIIKCMKLSEYLWMGIPVILWLSLFGSSRFASLLSILDRYKVQAQSVTSTWGSSNVQSPSGEVVVQNVGIHHFGFNLKYIIAVFRQMFAVNFLWLVITVTCITFIIYYVKKKKVDGWSDYYPIVGAVVGGSLINCTFYTYLSYRYKIPVSLLTLILCIVILSKVIRLSALRTFFVVISVLFLAEQYVLIDPISSSPRVKFDENSGTNIVLDDSIDKDDYVRLIMPVNQQGSEYGLFLQEILESISYDDSAIILLPDMNGLYNSQYLRSTYVAADMIYYDTDHKKMNVLSSEGDKVNFGTLYTDGHIDFYNLVDDDSIMNYKRVYYLDFNLVKGYDANNVIRESGFSEISRGNVQYRTWKADIIELSYDDSDGGY